VIDPALFRTIDLIVFVIANLTNLLLAIMFLFRARGKAKSGSAFGWSAVILGIPLLAVVVLNALGDRPWWTFIQPGLLILYDAVEFGVDYLVKFDFRHSRWLGPYLGLYYLALMGMIGYTFTVGIFSASSRWQPTLSTWLPLLILTPVSDMDR
jgi:hypothetical protein